MPRFAPGPHPRRASGARRRPVGRGAAALRARGTYRIGKLSLRAAADLAALACLTELAADKPGNVTLRRGLPGLSPGAFLASAAALRAAFARRGQRRVGALVLDAVRRTRRRARTNTNLGLALILAPLALAATRPGTSAGGGLRARLRAVLRSLTRRDAEEVYAAIRLAEPGGMGKVRQEDVGSPPSRDLRACMELAARRDSIAAEYARDYAITFGLGAPALRRALRRGEPMRRAVRAAFLALLAARRDSLIARRHGEQVAGEVSRRAARILGADASGARATAPAVSRRLAALDHWLRRRHLNPGTTADLTAAAIFVVLAEGAG